MKSLIKRSGTPFRCIMISCTLLFFITPAVGQDISKFYTARHQENGIVYFIYEQSGFKNETSNLDYDITYLSTSDSVTFNFSLVSKDELIIDSLSLINDSLTLKEKATRIFVEPKKDNLTYRYSVRFPYNDFKKFFEKDNPTILIGSDKAQELRIKSGKWKEQSSIIKKIFSLIALNR